MATLRDIAGELNISTAVVSRVLNGKSDVWASPATRQRIFEVAKELGYRPSATARALTTGRTMQLGVIVGETPLFDRLDYHGGQLGGLMQEALRHHYRVSLLPLEGGRPGEEQLRNWIQEKTCDAFCLFSEHLGAAELEELRRCEQPRVLIGDPEASDDTLGATVVDFDNFAYGREAAAWLREQGHANIAWAMAVGEGDQPHAVELRAGYQAALREGTSPMDPIIWPYSLDDRDLIGLVRSGQATAAIVRGAHEFIRWVTTLFKFGFRLPEDFTLLALVSEQEFEAVLLGGLIRYGAIHLHSPRALGHRSAELLLAGINGAAMPRRVLIPTVRPPFWGVDGRSGPEMVA